MCGIAVGLLAMDRRMELYVDGWGVGMNLKDFLFLFFLFLFALFAPFPFSSIHFFFLKFHMWSGGG